MKKQNIIILILTLIIIVLATGYSVYSTTVDARLKEARVKNLEVIFNKVVLEEEVDSRNASASISRNKKDIYMSIPEMYKINAYAKFKITVKNVGTLPARLRSVRETSYSRNGSLTAKYEDISTFNRVLNPGQTGDFYVIVNWKNDIEGENSLKFYIALDYVQEGKN